MLSESKFHELQTRWQESGLNVKEFCTNEGIAPATFYYWKKKIKENTRSKGFIPLVVKPAPALNQRNERLLSANHKQDEEVFIELVYPNGTLLRVKKDLDLSLLRTLIHLYE
jgi:Transposase